MGANSPMGCAVVVVIVVVLVVVVVLGQCVALFCFEGRLQHPCHFFCLPLYYSPNHHYKSTHARHHRRWTMLSKAHSGVSDVILVVVVAVSTARFFDFITGR